jgi:hypothetical protein
MIQDGYYYHNRWQGPSLLVDADGSYQIGVFDKDEEKEELT